MTAGTLVVRNCRLFDGYSPELMDGAEIVIKDGLIAEINEKSGSQTSCPLIDVQGRFVMPGLIDAHFHAYGTDWKVVESDRTHVGLRALHARRVLEDAARRGFTTVRDAGGGDYALVLATERGLIRGPRVLPSGLALSQTGGHGDFRPLHEESLCGCSYSGTLSMVVDGPDEVRRAAREQLRKGATQIKLFLSGGVLSPSDPLWMAGFSDEEITAAVEEAARRRTYVMAHAHTADAAVRCIKLGVRSIEHGSMLTKDAVDMICESGTFVVPTLSPMWVVRTLASELGIKPSAVAKAVEVGRCIAESFEMLVRAGAKVGFGTDLLGPQMDLQSNEFLIRKSMSSPLQILRSVTSVNANLLGMQGEIGRIAPGSRADFLVIEGDPTRDITVLANAQNIKLVVRDSDILKDAMH